MKPSNSAPGANEFGQLRSYLARAGVSQKWIKSVIGTGAKGRTRAEITNLLRAALKELPKASE